MGNILVYFLVISDIQGGILGLVSLVVICAFLSDKRVRREEKESAEKKMKRQQLKSA